MRTGIRSFPAWLQQVAVVAGFYVAYVLLRLGSHSLLYWMPQMGLRLVCVLLLPRRYWPSLLVTEVIVLLPWAYACVPEFGWFGFLCYLFPTLPLVMLPIWLLRKHLPGGTGIDSTAQSPMPLSRMTALLLCIGIITLLASAQNLFLLSLTWKPGEDSWASMARWVPRYLLGNYLGCLIITPLALAAYAGAQSGDMWRILLARAYGSRLVREGCAVGLGGLGLLIMLTKVGVGETGRQILWIALFLPVAWMAIRYGWQGAALAGAATSVCIMLTLPGGYDVNTILAQAFIACLLTMLLPLGVHIGELNAQRKAAQRAANHDALTGLPNRALFDDRLRMAVQRAPRREGKFALAMLDLGGFKHVNDTHGHPVGDALLQAVAARLNGAMRSGDTVARWGGDEFALIFEDVTDMAALLTRCQQLVEALAMPYALAGGGGSLSVEISASIGIVGLGAGYQDKQLIQLADHALYQAKKVGKNRCVLADVPPPELVTAGWGAGAIGS